MKNYSPKPLFIERMKLLLKDEEDLRKFYEFAKTKPKKSIRVNTLRISPENPVGFSKGKGDSDS